jgi:hypothetical protein
MKETQSEIIDRCRKLGLQCDTIATDKASSVLAALSCFPMYMVANVHAWTSDTQFRVPLLDLPGSEHIRESFVLGSQEGKFDIEEAHRRVLSTLVSNPKPSDLVFYEYALETLQMAFAILTPNVVDNFRVAIARMIVAVAKASGEGVGGTGPKVNPQEASCIKLIIETLSLTDSDSAAELLAEFL